MALYIFIIVFELIIFSSVAKKKSCNSNKLLLFFMLLLFFFSALRSAFTGGDLERYLPIFHDTADFSLWSVLISGGSHEWGFSLFERLIAIISSTDRAFIAGTSLLFISLSYYAIKLNSTNKFLSLLLFTCILYFGSFNIIRASISIVIGLLLIRTIESRNLKLFSIGIICAVLFQRTSIALFPIYFLWNLRYSPTRLLLIIGCTLMITFMLSGSVVIDLLNMYFHYQIKDLGEADMWAEKASRLTNMAIFLLLSTVVLIKSYTGVQDKKMEFYIHVVAVATCLQCFSSLFVLLNRLSLFYYAYLIYIVPYVVDNTTRYTRFFIQSYFIFSLIIMAILGFGSDVHGIIPYKMF